MRVIETSRWSEQMTLERRTERRAANSGWPWYSSILLPLYPYSYKLVSSSSQQDVSFYPHPPTHLLIHQPIKNGSSPCLPSLYPSTKELLRGGLILKHRPRLRRRLWCFSASCFVVPPQEERARVCVCLRPVGSARRKSDIGKELQALKLY